MPHILIVEDETIIRSALRRLLERNQYQVSEAGSVQEAQERFSIPTFDLIVSDLRLPGAPGTELIKLGQGTPVLIMTSYASLRSAVDSMKMGAVDYIAKPFDHDEMLQAVARILRDRQSASSAPAERPAAGKAANGSEKPGIDNSNGEIGIIGSCPPMQDLYSKIRKVAPTDSNVLIQGESGTGKELVARALHNLSKRAKAPMISVNCAAIPESLIESELFGHEKGAFTGASAGRAGLVEAADGGTLFLDEIGELPLEAQARLLRVLQEGEIRRVGSVQSQKVDVRLIAATHRDLKSLAKIGQFREDLYYRLHVIALKLPALRERGADVNEIATAFLARQSARINRTDLKFAADAEQAIRHYSWPGNVRELENAVERAVILSESPEISAELLGIDIELSDLDDDDFIGLPPQQGGGSNNSHEPTEDLSLEDYFQHFVLEHQDHMTETELARKLGVSRKCLWERRQRLGIPRRKTGVASES
ncbi:MULTISPECIES: sigma-54 dependent transcriptional regulator [Pseudomonas]|jgi:two-component system, NtrC family, response regulator HydG|uniref:sigma-54-dependent transcriptional regulator n=1 Tax=Pseudomonas TaxID=286 RepID=UPI000281C804|nr:MULTISPECIES: sigma-54 dependent transcriptional regulator [Pseudomonas]MDP9032655.1 sigma-54 dependent transcriptional regulator [Pseudomonadota bacterium]AUO21209.1 sigma-54-dependent Fis family transcriptional regulator [Pseudomonas sp. NC02]MBT1270232.1 sigma-54-dependent Fis family transcriptional regulator [Pseudomonas sp. VS38]MDE1908634.1 sigma-54-dependent Fis family transcriptional regulator [Pseudomonas sp.]MDE2189237.1 sigma-54-dependent Fis family transcriptional regulator [Pse|eukprot:gene22469-34408_t